MKFCPQCGTTFEPDARFCLECGFDKSTVEPSGNEPVTTPLEIIDEPSAAKDIQPETQEIKPGCPKCGTNLTAGDRFCAECGFDTTSSFTPNPVSIEIPIVEEIPAIKEIISPVIIEEKPEVEKENKQFCSQCGLVIASGERFCQECGFDTQNTANASDTGYGNTPPASTTPEPAFTPQVAEPTAIPTQAPKPKPTPISTPEPIHQQRQNQSAGTIYPVKKETAKKPWILILLVILGVGVLGAGGWFAYNKFLATPAGTTADTSASIEMPESTYTDTSEPESEIAVTSTETTTEKPKTATKSKSKIDQELAKYREQEKNKAAQQNTSSQTTKPDAGVKISSIPGGNTVVTKVIHEVGRKEEPKNKKPKNPVKLTLQESTMIVRITTDHYNDGMGTSGAGNITIKDRNGKTLGTYKANGKTGKDGAPNAKWVAEPNKIFEKGTYYIWDSDFSTWSKNFIGNAFVVVEGYELD